MVQRGCGRGLQSNNNLAPDTSNCCHRHFLPQNLYQDTYVPKKLRSTYQ